MASPVPALSVVIPVYNSAPILPDLVERLQPVLEARGAEYELVLVDDDSPDGSWKVIQDLARTRPWIRGLHLMRNFGQHNSLLCGIRNARFERIATMDDDLQHPPEELPKLLEKLEEGFDVVYGTPESQQHGLFRDLASQMTKIALQSAVGASTARKVSAFRVMRTDLRDAFADYRSQFVSIDVLLTWGSTRFTAVTVRHDPRLVGVSNYTLRKLLAHAMNMMTGFSTRPLQFASLVGFAFTLFGMLVLAFVVGRYLWQGSSVPGFAFLASVIAIFSGAQLFALGIIGEYIARMHFRMMERPAYAVKSHTEAGPSAADASETHA